MWRPDDDHERHRDEVEDLASRIGHAGLALGIVSTIVARRTGAGR
jgi:hypothetical protein